MYHKTFRNTSQYPVGRPLRPPSAVQEEKLLQILTAGFLDQIAMKIPTGIIEEGSKFECNCAYLSCDHDLKMHLLYLHPSSTLFTTNPKHLAPFVCYQQILQSSSETKRCYTKNCTAVEPAWLASIAVGHPKCKPLKLLFSSCSTSCKSSSVKKSFAAATCS